MISFRVFIISFLINCLFLTGIAQVPFIQWQKTYGGTLEDEAFSVSVLSDGNYIVVGGAGSIDGDVLNHHNIFIGFHVPDFWLIKIDATGNLLWNKCYGGSEYDEARSVIQTIDSGFIISGEAGSQDGDVTGVHGFGNDVWIVKTDSNGNLQWQKCYGSNNEDFSFQISLTRDSGFIVVGGADNSSFDFPGNHGDFDVALAKINSNGVRQWGKCFGGSSAEYGSAVKQTIDGGYLIAASTVSNDGNVSGHHNTFTGDIWVFKVDSLGSIQWQKCLGGTGDDFAAELLVNDDGSAFVFGTTSSNDGDVTGHIGSSDFWLFKIDSTGNILWQKCFGGIYFERGQSISKTSDGGFVMIGDAVADDGMVTGNHGGFDYWICKIDSLGNFEWGKALGGAHDEHPFSIKETLDGGFIVVGSTVSLHTGDVTTNHGSKDYWVVKLSPPGLSVSENENIFMEFTVFQNNDQLQIKFFSKKYSSANLCMYDVSGKKVFESAINVNEGINYKQIDCSGFTRGLYFAKIYNEKFSQNAKIFID